MQQLAAAPLTSETLLQALIVGKRKLFLEAITQVLREHSTFPQLYVYSASDHVIPHASVKAWAKARSPATQFQLHAVTHACTDAHMLMQLACEWSVRWGRTGSGMRNSKDWWSWCVCRRSAHRGAQ